MVGERVQKFVFGKENLKYLVLAERNSKNLAEGIASLYAAWNSLRRSVFWKQKVSGAIAVLEVTYSKTRKDWHPHLNILFEGDYIPFKQLNLMWRKITGDGRTTHIKQANEGTVFELIKYTLKVAEYEDSQDGRVLQLLFDDPRVLDEFLSVVYGMRLIRQYGTFRHMGNVEREEEECPDCGSTCIADFGPVSHAQLSFDFEKQVFRVRGSPPNIDFFLREAVEFQPWQFVSDPYGVAVAVEMRKRARQYEKEVSQRFQKQALRQPAA